MSVLQEKIKAYLAKHPKVPAKDVALHFNVHSSYIYALRKKLGQESEISRPIVNPEITTEPEAPKPTGRRVTIGASQAAIAKAMGVPLDEYVKEGLKQGVFQYDDEKPNEGDETDVDTVLDARAKDYGKFIEGAEIMQMLKRLVHNYIEDRGTPLAFDQREAIDMIIHKLGRIINGNPDKVDHWVDIAGYATLVADRLQGDVR